MDKEEMIILARKHLDKGLCFDRDTHITRATDAELIAFAEAIIEAYRLEGHGQRVADYMLERYPNLL